MAGGIDRWPGRQISQGVRPDGVPEDLQLSEGGMLPVDTANLYDVLRKIHVEQIKIRMLLQHVAEMEVSDEEAEAEIGE